MIRLGEKKDRFIKALHAATTTGITISDLAGAAGLKKQQCYSLISSHRTTLQENGKTITNHKGIYRIEDYSPKGRKPVKGPGKPTIEDVHRFIAQNPGCKANELLRAIPNLTRWALKSWVTRLKSGKMILSRLRRYYAQGQTEEQKTETLGNNLFKRTAPRDTVDLGVNLEDLKRVPPEELPELLDIAKKAAQYQAILKCCLAVNDQFEALREALAEGKIA